MKLHTCTECDGTFQVDTCIGNDFYLGGVLVGCKDNLGDCCRPCAERSIDNMHAKLSGADD